MRLRYINWGAKERQQASEEVLRTGTSEGPRHGAIIQSGVPLEFLRSKQEEEAVWKAQFEVGSQIQDHLDRALELHRTTDFWISNVSAFPWGLLVFGFVSCALLMLFHL